MTTTNEEILKALDELKAASTAAKNILKGGPGSGPHKGGGDAKIGSLSEAAGKLSGVSNHNAAAAEHTRLSGEHMTEANKLARNAGNLIMQDNPGLAHIVLDRANDHEAAAQAHEAAAKEHSAGSDKAAAATARAAEASTKADRSW